MNAQKFGAMGEYAVAMWLAGNRLPAVPSVSHGDLDCSGVSIEVKTMRPRIHNGRTAWSANIHRHGVLDETGVDFYVLRLEEVPEFKAAIHLVIPAPINKYNVIISFRSLLTKYAKYYNAIDPLRRAVAKRKARTA